MEKEISIINAQWIDIKSIISNKGQIPGLPSNPRTINKEDLASLKQSILDNPEMLGMRELIVYPFDNKYIVIGGNMRLRAMKELGYESAPCKILPVETSADILKAILIKDNVQRGEWDDKLIKDEWDFDQVSEWGVDVSSYAAWGKGNEWDVSRCNLKEKTSFHFRENFAYIGSFKKSKEGQELDKIKTDDNVSLFAHYAIKVINSLIGLKVKEGWCLITTPKRRHKEENFATKVCKEISSTLGIPFYEDVLTCSSKHRINAVFNVEYQFPETNIILYDDIVTTGSTIISSNKALFDKNIINIVGIINF